ncbi:MAG: cation:proton antiporter [Acidimicrobiales bacterium]
MIVASIRSEPAFTFFVLALIIIFGPLLAQKLRLPGLIGLLVGGALIGPNMLDVLDSYVGIQALGDLGVLYLIFLAGLGLDMKTFEQHRNTALSFGLITAIIPWLLGTGVALVGGYDVKTAILIGSFWASFTLVSYGVVSKYGLTRNPSVAATVGASSITDTIGLIALAVVVGSETGDSRGVVLVLGIVAGLAVVIAYCLVVLPAVTRWFFGGMGQERELRFMMVLCGFTSAAVVADLVGIEALIGAFFAGLGLNRLVPNRSHLMARTDFFGNALFIPAFLVSVGLLVDPSVMFRAATLRIALGLAAALIVGKAVAAIITGRIFKFSRAEVGLMFSLSSAQAAATLASTIIGYEIGLYAEDVVNAVMVVIVISLFVSALGSEYFAPRVKPTQTGELRLGEAVVVPIDDGADPTDAIWLAGQIAESDGGLVVPLAVAVTDQPDALTRTRARLDQFKASLRGLGLTGQPELRVAQSIAGGVDRFVLENDGSLVLLPWPGPRDLRTTLLGGGNDEIAAATDRPVAMAAMKGRSFERVLVVVTPDDLKPGSSGDARMALALGERVAQAGSIELVIGPASAESLTELGFPPNARSAGTDTGIKTQGAFLDQYGSVGDLVVLPAGPNPVSLLDRLKDRDFSMVTTARRRNDRWCAPDGALGVTVPRWETSEWTSPERAVVDLTDSPPLTGFGSNSRPEDSVDAP